MENTSDEPRAPLPGKRPGSGLSVGCDDSYWQALFIAPKAVRYYLGNIYAKFELKGRQQLRRYLAESRRPVPA
jgi:hypothetical protein